MDLEAKGSGAALEGGDAALALLLFVVLLALIDVGFAAGQHKYTIRASLWAVAVLARGLSMRPDMRR